MSYTQDTMEADALPHSSHSGTTSGVQAHTTSTGDAIAGVPRSTKAQGAEQQQLPSDLCSRCRVAQSIFNEGRSDEGEAYCEELRRADPAHIEGHLLLGAMRFARGFYPRALELNDLARRIVASETCTPADMAARNRFALGYMELGGILFTHGDYVKAEQAFRSALVIDASMANVHNDLGNLLKAQGRTHEARASYMEAIRVQPNLAVAWNNLGCVDLDEGESTVAIHNFSKAAYFDPTLECVYTNMLSVLGTEGHSVALTHLANILRDEGRLAHSIIVYKRALQSTNSAMAHAGLASVLQRCGQLRQAAHHYGEAIYLHPVFVECHTNLGHILRDLGDLTGARTSFLNAVQLNPASAEDFNNLACVCKDLGLITEAVDHYKAALRLKADSTNVYCNLAHSLLMICDWRGYDDRTRRVVELVTQQVHQGVFPSVHPHHSFLYPLSNPVRRAIARAHALAAERAVALSARPVYTHDRLRPLRGRLRIGYVSSDFKDHPTAHLMQSVPGFHDRANVEVFCYSLAANDGSVYRRKIEAETEHFVDLSSVPDNVAAADMIYADHIHVLVNLNGYTKGARTEIFALRPAPIQVMWLGYPGTSGASFMDYILTDAATTPLALHGDAYSESVVYMPHTFFVGDHRQMFPLPERVPAALVPIKYTTAEAGLLARALPGGYRVHLALPFVAGLDDARAQYAEPRPCAGNGAVVKASPLAAPPIAGMASVHVQQPSPHGPSTGWPPVSVHAYALPGSVGTVYSLMPHALYPMMQPIPQAYGIPFVQTNYLIPGAGFPMAFIPSTPYVQPQAYAPSHHALPASAGSSTSTVTSVASSATSALLALAVAAGEPRDDVGSSVGLGAPSHRLEPVRQSMRLVGESTGAMFGADTPIATRVHRHDHLQDGPPSKVHVGVASPASSKAGVVVGRSKDATAKAGSCHRTLLDLGWAAAMVPRPHGLDDLAGQLLARPAVPAVHVLAGPPALHAHALPSAWPSQVALGAALTAQPMVPLAVAPPTGMCDFMSPSGVAAALCHSSYRAPPAHAPLPGPVGSITPPQPPLTRAYYGLPANKVVFCSFNQIYKIDPQVFASWLRILARAPNAVIWLLRFPAAGEPNLRSMAEGAGIPHDRFVFSNVASKIEHVRRGALADMCLDTTACNGHTTGMDILWAGTPMLTCPGETLASRVATSQLLALGCPELVCASMQEYEDKAVQYATDAGALAALQVKVREARRTSPLFDTRLLTHNLERCYYAMWQVFQDQRPPCHLSVPPD